MPGTGERPPWFKADKYKSVDKQAEAAVALEQKLGPAAELIGAPEGDYQLPKPAAGVEGEFDPADPLLVGFTKVAKEMGLSQKAFDRVVQHMSSVIATADAAAQASVAEALSQIGGNVAQRVEAVKTFIVGRSGQAEFDALDAAIGTNVQGFLALERLLSKVGLDARLAPDGGQGGVGFSKADVEAERYKKYPEGHKLAGKVMYEHDTAHRTKVDGMWKQLFPGEDRQSVG